MKIYTFEGFEGSAEIDLERDTCRGKLLFIPDLVTYEADTPKELRRAFEEAVVDYLETCRELGREPHRPFKGSFQVRVSSELHRAASVRAAADEVTLNEVMERALDCYVNGSAGDVHNVTIRVDTLQSFTSSPGAAANDAGSWKSIVPTTGAAHVKH